MRLGTFEPFQFVYPGRYYSPDGRTLLPLADFVPVNGRPIASCGPGSIYDPRQHQRRKSGKHGCHCHGQCSSCKQHGMGRIFIPRGLRGLGQDDGVDSGSSGDFSSGGFDAGMIFGGGATGGAASGFDTGGVSIDPTTIPGYTPPGSTDIPVDQIAPTPLPYVDASSGLPPGSTIDMSTGTIFGPGGSFTIFSDGSFMDGQGNLYDANGNLLAASQPNAPAQASPPGAGSGSSGGRSGGGGGGSPKSPQQAQQQLSQLQLLCLQNPRLAICQGQAGLINQLASTAGTLLASQYGISPQQLAAQQGARYPYSTSGVSSFSSSSVPSWVVPAVVIGGGLALVMAFR